MCASEQFNEDFRATQSEEFPDCLLDHAIKMEPAVAYAQF
jgi:hypothetical protein